MHGSAKPMRELKNLLPRADHTEVCLIAKLEVLHQKKNSKPRLVAVFHRAHGAGAVPSRLPGYKLQTALWHKLQIIDDKLQTALQYKFRLVRQLVVAIELD
jgi:hypothetical protein